MQTREDTYFVVTSPGLEKVTLEELGRLALNGLHSVAGGIEFKGSLRDLYRVNMWARSASRVLARLGEVNARDFPTLYQRLSRLPWGRFVKPGTGCDIRVTSRSSRLVHGGRVAETCREALSKALGASCPMEKKGQKIFLRLSDNRCLVSIDSSGDHLHRRGYRSAAVNAPLRENLAAACLLACGYDGSETLVDLMTGSGTFATEAALIALRRAPGRDRGFAFMNWPKYREGLWQQLRAEARRHELSALRAPILALDNNPRAVAAAAANFESLGVEGLVRLQLADMRQVDLPERGGLMICNPPYGERLGKNAALTSLYRDIGELFAGRAPEWRGGMVCPDSGLVRACGLRFKRLMTFSNGGIKVALLLNSDD